MSKSIIRKCPACGNDLAITKLSCRKCNIDISGDFQQNIFSELSNEERNFVEQFLICEGNLSKMQELLNESYWTVKGRLDAVLVNLGLKTANDIISTEVIKMSEPTQKDGIIAKKLKEKLSACGGKSQMSMLKGDDVTIWLAGDGSGIVTAGLKNVTLKWEHFDAIIQKANSLGGKMFRGDSAAQSGARIGSDDLPSDTVDAFISTKYYAAKEGDTILRRSTYYCGILAWADIVDNNRSKGDGGYILVKPQYRNQI